MECPICKREFNRKGHTYSSFGFIYVPVIETPEKTGGETFLVSLESYSEDMARNNFDR
ncbi:MAG: hypothetical protein ACOC5T_04115 [Elusimicrobiota bacterium]